MNVIRARRSQKKSIWPALAGLLPFFLTWTMIPIWLHLRPDILADHLVPFMFFVGAAFAYQVGLIITAHLTKSRFPYLNVLFVPIMFGTIDSIGPELMYYTKGLVGWPSVLGDGVYQIAYVFLCLGLAWGVYGSFVVSTIRYKGCFFGRYTC